MSDIHPHSRDDLNEQYDFGGRVIVPTVTTNHTGHICLPLYHGGTQCWCLRRCTRPGVVVVLSVERERRRAG